MSIRNNVLSATAIVLAAGGAQAQLETLLIVDLTVANQITISATNGASAASLSGGDTTGVLLADLLSAGTSNAISDVLVSGDITNVGNPSDGTPDLFYSTFGAGTGLNLWSWSSDTTVNFTAGSQAFSGSGTWNVSPAFYADMLAGNSGGTIYFPADTDDDIAGATAIGTWNLIPAPSTAALLGLGGLAAVRRRR